MVKVVLGGGANCFFLVRKWGSESCFHNIFFC